MVKKKKPNTPKRDLEKVDGVVKHIEGEYFLDYAVFTGLHREYVCSVLETHFRSNDNDFHRRAYVLALYREEYSAYEDLGGFIYSFLPGKDDLSLPMTRLITYAPGSVKLGSVFSDGGVTSADQLMERLNLTAWIPSGWNVRFPDIDLNRALRRACFYMFEDCRQSQKAEGVPGFNKIKHGLVFVSEARRFFASHPPGPGLIFATPKWHPGSVENPVTLMTVTITDTAIEQRRTQIHFVQRTLRLLALLYVIKQYPAALSRIGVSNALDAFTHDRCVDLLNFCRELANVPWTPTVIAPGTKGGVERA